MYIGIRLYKIKIKELKLASELKKGIGSGIGIKKMELNPGLPVGHIQYSSFVTYVSASFAVMQNNSVVFLALVTQMTSNNRNKTLLKHKLLQRIRHYKV